MSRRHSSSSGEYDGEERARKSKRMFDESLDAEPAPPTVEEHFKQNVFIKIIDTLVDELARRTQVYNDLFGRFIFLFRFRDLPMEELRATTLSSFRILPR